MFVPYVMSLIMALLWSHIHELLFIYEKGKASLNHANTSGLRHCPCHLLYPPRFFKPNVYKKYDLGGAWSPTQWLQVH